MWPIGKIMVSVDPPNQILYRSHLALGLLVATATVARVISGWRGQKPEELSMPRWERILFVANHYALYGLLLILSVTGIVVLLRTGGFDAAALRKNQDRPKDVHELASLVFLLMIVAHVAGVVYYQVTKGKTLRRMGVPLG
jgi:cytochrome b561